MTTIGIDNGTTGSIAIISPDGVFFEPSPTCEAVIGRAGKVVKRIAWAELFAMIDGRFMDNGCRAYIERPFTGSAMMINTTVLAARAHEATMIVLEQLGIGYETVDSRQWQKAMLGDVTGSANLKKASMLRGIQMFPAHAQAIKEHGDADSLLMCHYYHNARNG